MYLNLIPTVYLVLAAFCGAFSTLTVAEALQFESYGDIVSAAECDSPMVITCPSGAQCDAPTVILSYKASDCDAPTEPFHRRSQFPSAVAHPRPAFTASIFLL